MKKYLLFIIILWGTWVTKGQENPVEFGKNLAIADTSVHTDRRATPGFRASMGFITDGHNSFMATSLSPEIRKPVSDRFRLRAGTSLTLISGLTTSPMSENRGLLSYGSIFVAGDYLITPRTTISGTAYRTWLLNNPGSTIGEQTITPQAVNGISVDVSYMITPHIFINVGVSVNQQTGSPLQGFGAQGNPTLNNTAIEAW